MTLADPLIIYRFRWFPTPNTDPAAITAHPCGTVEEAVLCVSAYQACLHLLNESGELVAAVGKIAP